MVIRKPKIVETPLVNFTRRQLRTQPEHAFDDGQESSRGSLFLLQLEDVVPFRGMKVVDGFKVVQYSGAYDGQCDDYCGYRQLGWAFALSFRTADAIAEAEFAFECRIARAYGEHFEGVYRAVSALVRDQRSPSMTLRQFLSEHGVHDITPEKLATSWMRHCDSFGG
jgi:hypothetical protein